MAKAESRCWVCAAGASVAEAGDGVDPAQAAALLEVVLRLDGEHHPGPFAGREGEARREHADDGVRGVAEDQRPSEHARVAAHPRPPEGVGEDHGAGAAGHVLAGEEGAPELGADAQHVEEVGADLERGELRALGAVVPDDGGVGVSGDGGEDGRVGLELAHRRPGELEAGLVVAVVDLPDVDQAVGLGVGERAEQGGVDRSEHGGVQADAHGEGEDDDRREPRPAPEVADGVTEVLEQRGHGGPLVQRACQ